MLVPTIRDVATHWHIYRELWDRDSPITQDLFDAGDVEARIIAMASRWVSLDPTLRAQDDADIDLAHVRVAARRLGQRGGRATTPAKIRAARRNGRLSLKGHRAS